MTLFLFHLLFERENKSRPHGDEIEVKILVALSTTLDVEACIPGLGCSRKRACAAGSLPGFENTT